MRDLHITEVAVVRPPVDTLQQLLSLQMAEPQELNARLTAAVEHQMNLHQDARAVAMQDQRVADRIIDAAVTQVITDLLDPTRRVMAGGLDEGMAAALNDVTKTLAEEAWNTMERCQAAIAMFQDQLNGRDQIVRDLGPDLGAELVRMLADGQSIDQQWQQAQNDIAAQGVPMDLSAAQRTVLDTLNYQDVATVQDLVNEAGRVAAALDQLKGQQEVAFDWSRQNEVMRLELQQKELAVDVPLAVGLVQQEVNAQFNRHVEWAFATTLSDIDVGAQGVYDTTQRLARGNAGERLAAEALAQDGHQILMYKPDIAGTNQGGIDLVTMHDDVLYLIDNKALTRDGNVSSVSALTTNFEQNLDAVRVQLEAAVADQARSAAEVEIYRKALEAIENEHYVRMVTNANIARDDQVLSGVTERLRAQEIEFLNVWP